ncbi:cobalt-precorrin 5A hydrolase [Paracoccus laeviglucosivorans]|uniref:Cobalt-precorrin 5A hydrolase n=2 Tax=Paracoccus laeviglucosivorans TaxID=1197861 RepID=A0A521DVC6_9RHOB|nr:cobalt-precorrin 5A hydrolase [Paracoccus laeviglucosivorans]
MGFRRAATLHSLYDALTRAGGCDALATPHDKAASPAIRALAAQLGVPLIPVGVAGIQTPTQSPRVIQLYHTGSVAEAAALSALAPGARIVMPRLISQDGMATAAIAEGDPL